MKKKGLFAAVMAGMMLVSQVTVFAAPSTDATTTILDEAVPLASGPVSAGLGNYHTTVAATSTGQNGMSVSVIADANTQVTERGEIVNNGLAMSFANDAAATAGLPQEVVGAINGINAGQPLSDAVNMPELAGYNALTGTHAIIATDPATGAVTTGNAQVQLYVPNLTPGIGEVSVLFYDNATGQWRIIPAVVDPVTNIVTVNITGSGTLTVIYK